MDGKAAASSTNKPGAKADRNGRTGRRTVRPSITGRATSTVLIPALWQKSALTTSSQSRLAGAGSRIWLYESDEHDVRERNRHTCASIRGWGVGGEWASIRGCRNFSAGTRNWRGVKEMMQRGHAPRVGEAGRQSAQRRTQHGRLVATAQLS